MAPDPSPYVIFPGTCPICHAPAKLLVGDRTTVSPTVHGGGCNGLFYYRCWLQEGLALPRVEYLAPGNAMKLMLEHGNGNRDDGRLYLRRSELKYPHSHPALECRRGVWRNVNQ